MKSLMRLLEPFVGHHCSQQGGKDKGEISHFFNTNTKKAFSEWPRLGGNLNGSFCIHRMLYISKKLSSLLRGTFMYILEFID